MARITIDVDLPPEVEITGYQRYQDGHGLEVRWPLPARCRCEKCGHDDVAHIEFKTIPQAIRDLNLWEQPCFWIYQLPSIAVRGNYRQHIIPPFKRKDVSYTYRFEQFALLLADRQHGGGGCPSLGDLGRDGRPDRRESIDRGSTDRSPACDHRHWAG